MGAHIKDGKFQSDKYPTCPPGKVPLSVEDPKAQPLLWAYAESHTEDLEFAEDLKQSLLRAGYKPVVHHMVQHEDLEWLLVTIDHANCLIRDEPLDEEEEEEADDIDTRLMEISERYGIEYESEDD